MGKDLKGKELGVGLTQRKDGKYSAKFTPKNGGGRKEKYFKKITDARKWLNDAKYEDEHSIYFDTDVTVDEWYQYWIEHCKADKVRDNTEKNYRTRYKYNIQSQIGYLKLNKVKVTNCQKILDDMYDDGYATGTIEQTKITLHAMFDAAVDAEYIGKNPVSKTVQCKVRDKAEARFLSVSEQEDFLVYSAQKMYDTAYRLVLRTGLRAGEIGGLRWSDIDFNNKVLSVNRTLLQDKKKGGFYFGEPKSKESKRKIPLSKKGIAILREQKILQMKNRMKSNRWSDNADWADLVFTTVNGHPVGASTFNTMIKRIINNINADRKINAEINNKTFVEFKKFSMHSLRHTFATRCIEAGMKPKVLQKILGHSTIQVTMDMYVHVMDEELEKEIQKVEENSVVNVS